MKILLILRHAKSSWDDPGLPDHDRPLKKRGRQDAPRIGRLLLDKGLVPDLILSSTAERAAGTSRLVAQECGFEGDIRLENDLYAFDAQAYLKVLRRTPDKFNTVMLVAHNPGLEELLQLLTGESTTLPTAALAHVNLPIAAWSKIHPELRATLVHCWRPKEL